MSDDLTQILQAVSDREQGAAERLLSIIYGELHRIASANLAREAPGHTLQPTALVNEAYLRLLGPAESSSDNVLDHAASNSSTETDSPCNEWNSRGHFFAAAAEAMRRILIDHARQKKRLKRGGDRDRIELDPVDFALETPTSDLLVLNDALSRLESIDEVKANVVKLRYFAGLTIEQTAEATGVSIATVKRRWYYARAWLRRELEKE